MIQKQSVKLVEGTDYDSWVQVFESKEAIKMRADAGLKILAYGGTLKMKECLLLLKWTIHKLSKR